MFPARESSANRFLILDEYIALGSIKPINEKILHEAEQDTRRREKIKMRRIATSLWSCSYDVRCPL